MPVTTFIKLIRLTVWLAGKTSQSERNEAETFVGVKSIKAGSLNIKITGKHEQT